MEAERLACWFNSLSLCRERYPYIADRLDVSFILPQAQGKLWIAEKLKNIIPQPVENTAIIGGWWCHYLAYALSSYTKYMCNYEIDPMAVYISKTFNRYQINKFTASQKDLNTQNFCSHHLKHGPIELVVNTSCEHMYPFSFMKNKIEKQLQNTPIYVLQSTDEDKHIDHINCVSGPKELAIQAGITDVYYSGTKKLSNGMKRFMVIGK